MTQPGQDQPADLYQVLGVDARAARADIVRAYRQLARTWHPDARPGDPAAEARFRMVTLAYEVLADPSRREAYDQAHRGAGGVDDGARQRPGRGGQRIPVRRVHRPPAGAPEDPDWPPLWAGPVVIEPPGQTGGWPE